MHFDPPELAKPVRDIIADVVTATQAAILLDLQAANSNIQQIHYLCAPDDEIIATLDELGQTQAGQRLKYPLVALFEDITVRHGLESGYFETSITLIIATRTEPTYKSAQRETASFIPILRPIHREFVKQLTRSPYIAESLPYFPCDVTDRKRWGRQKLIELVGGTSKGMGDHIDAIEIANLELKLWPKPVTKPPTFFTNRK